MPDVVKAVINTNVFVSALLSPTGASAKILDRFYNSEFQLAFSAEILDEYRSVILEFENRIHPDDAIEFIELVEAQSIQYVATITLRVCRDPSDNKFLECAISSGANFLVTKNLRHYPIKKFQGVRIVTVGQFLTILERLEQS